MLKAILSLLPFSSILVLNLIVVGCYNPTNDYFLNFDKKEQIYYSSFTENDSVYWTGDDGEFRAYIKDGQYYFESLTEYASYTVPKFSLDPEDDFEVEISVSGPEDEFSGYYGLVLGPVGPDSLFLDLMVNNSGSYVIETDQMIAKGSFGKTSFNQFKTLTIRKLDDQLTFYINRKNIHTYLLEGDFHEIRTGPLTGENSIVWVDEIRVTKLFKLEE